MTDTRKHKLRLLARLKELDTRLHDIEAELSEPLPADFGEQAIELEDDEVLEQLGRAGAVEIRQILAALQRIRSGQYGVCVECGSEILEARLEAAPHAALCRVCAAAREQRR